MSSAPLVSVVVNNYNYARFLGQAIGSALAQRWAPLEVIVVDDGSTDESRAVLAAFGDRIVPVLKANGGQASAINAGVAAARGEIVCLLDADDLWYPEKVAVCVEALRAAGPDGIAFLRHDLLTLHEGAAATAREERPFVGLAPGCRRERVRHEDLLVHRRAAPTSALVIPRRALDALGPIPDEAAFRISADLWLFTHLARHGDVLSLGQVLGRYRIHGANGYFAEGRDLAQMRRALAVEVALAESMPAGVRCPDRVLRLAHALAGSDPHLLGRLGGYRARLGRILGGRAGALLRSRTVESLAKETLRTLHGRLSRRPPPA